MTGTTTTTAENNTEANLLLANGKSKQKGCDRAGPEIRIAPTTTRLATMLVVYFLLIAS